MEEVEPGNSREVDRTEVETEWEWEGSDQTVERGKWREGGDSVDSKDGDCTEKEELEKYIQRQNGGREIVGRKEKGTDRKVVEG